MVILSEWLAAQLDKESAEPAYRQLLQLMQQAILTGRLAPGSKLPSSRTLAGDLGECDPAGHDRRFRKRGDWDLHAGGRQADWAGTAIGEF